MNIILFAHPSFLSHQSMPRYAQWLAKGMRDSGHLTEIWSPQPKFYQFPVPSIFKKWMGYIDQYLVFPSRVKKKLKKLPSDTIFVFTDHALGPWVPLVSKRPHIIHCHDFLAQQSALGQIPENPTSWTGKQYQAYIRKGYASGKNFISISYKTQKDLHGFLKKRPPISEVVYNAVNPQYYPVDTKKALKDLQNSIDLSLENGFLLHIGGNQWYKNRLGIVWLYNEWRKQYNHPLPLLLIGEHPDAALQDAALNSPFMQDIHFISGLSDKDLLNAYNVATVFLFPSLAEGFGWPIAEAMACGCPVITTGEAPMTEVGGDAAIYVPKMPLKGEFLQDWLEKAAAVLQKTATMPAAEREVIRRKGLENIKRFDSATQLKVIESIYKNVLGQES